LSIEPNKSKEKNLINQRKYMSAISAKEQKNEKCIKSWASRCTYLFNWLKGHSVIAFKIMATSAVFRILTRSVLDMISWAVLNLLPMDTYLAMAMDAPDIWLLSTWEL